MRKFILVLLFIICTGISVSAQTPSPSDADVDLMQRAQMVFEIKSLRAETAAKTEQITLLKDQVVDLKKAGVQYELRIAELKDATTHFNNAADIAPKIFQLYDARIDDFKTENIRLRDENAKLRKSRDKSNVVFGIVGAVVDHFLF